LLSTKHCNRRFRRAGWRECTAGLLLAFVFALPAAGQGQTAVVRSDPAVLEIGLGESATISIVLADARDVYGIDLRAAFDPQLVEVVDADPGSDGVQLTPGAFLRPDFVARNTADNAAGTLRYAITQVNPTQPASGTGVVLTVRFRGKAAGEAPLTLGPVEMADRQGQSLPVTVEHGTIRVVKDQAATPLPAPTQPMLSTATAAPSAAPAVTSQPAASPVVPGGLPCAGGALLPSLGLVGLAGWAVRRRDTRESESTRRWGRSPRPMRRKGKG
jgi:hypothetical protein